MVMFSDHKIRKPFVRFGGVDTSKLKSHDAGIAADDVIAVR